MVEIISNSVDETVNYGIRLSSQLGGGELIGLSGELGSGKTAFVKGIASGFGYRGYVKSPTFTVVNQYNTEKITLLHIDVYRLSSFEELLLIGFETFIRDDTIILIEWFDKFFELSQYKHIDIHLEYLGESGRKIIFNTNCDKYKSMLEHLCPG